MNWYNDLANADKHVPWPDETLAFFYGIYAAYRDPRKIVGQHTG